MADLLEPYAPLDTLKPVAPDLWIVDGPEIHMGWLGLKVPFNTRMTVARLPAGGLWVHSPIAPDEGLFAAVDTLGPVAHLIAPNTLHYWYLGDWAARYPGAAVWAAPDLDRKAKRRLPDHVVLGEAPPEAWQGVFDQVTVAGDVLTEVDFFHRPSRTLILTDLIENFEPTRVRSRFWRALMRWSGAADPDGKAPVDMRATFWRHLPAMRAAAERMIGWAPERIILAHGRWYERDGTAELRRAFRWALR